MKTLTAFYDLAYGPVSFDFVTWLVRAMKERDARKCDHLHVVIVPKEDGLGGFSRHWGKHDEYAARWRLWHIAIASCPLAGATVTIAATREQADLLISDEPEFSEAYWRPEGKAHLMGPLVDAARAGERIPQLRATEAARRYVATWLAGVKEPVVTLTLRGQDTDPERNSNMTAWVEFAAWLLASGYHPIRLEDTNVALGEGRGHAELDPDLRLGLYERAVMNCIGNNGPQELLKFSPAPYLIFGVALSEGWKEHFRKHFHMQPGEQVPWAGVGQRLVYRPDSFEVLRDEFSKWASGTR